MNTSTADNPEVEKPELGLVAGIFWAINRHELVAGAAEAFLTAKASGEVQRIATLLGRSTTLRNLAGWADSIKRRGPLPGDDVETVAFLTDPRNKAQDTWHYVNLPANADIYDRERYPTFTRDDDVVQMTVAAIDVLTGKSDRFSELNALRLLTHYVGDIHQPIHVGCAYIDRSTGSPKLVLDPEVAATGSLQHDRGGGRIILPHDGGRRSLHEYWDGMGKIETAAGAAGADAGNTPDIEAPKQVRKLVEMVRTSQADVIGLAGVMEAVEPRERVRLWTQTSLEGARQAYQSLVAVGEAGSNVTVSWEGKRDYDDRCRPVANRQLTLAARNLANLLNDIWS